MKRGIKYAVLMAALTMTGTVQAGAVGEAEPNDSAYAAQRIETPEAMSIAAAMGNPGGTAVQDVDFYKFYGQEGDVVDLDIDGAALDPYAFRGFNSIMAVYDASLIMVRYNDNASPADPGSVGTLDSRIDKFRLPATGYYIVGVTHSPRMFMRTGATVTSTTYYKNGNYTLAIAGVTPELIHINIEIKPGSGEFTPINPKSKGKVPVALLSNATFMAPQVVDRSSLTFGATGYENSLGSCGNGEDVNNDGLVDLVCHFYNQTADFAKGDLEGIVRGKTLVDGRAFEGRGLLKVLPAN